MAYTPTQWATGDKISSAKMNKLEQGVAGAQPVLVSGTNIKTVNGQSLLGGGNIDIQASSVHNYDDTGRNLKQIFGTAAALHTAVAAGDFSNIQVGDYWDLAISGTYRDFGSYTCPAGTQLYSDTALTQTAGTASTALEAKYVDGTYCQVSQSGTKYCRTSACLAYYERTVNLPAERFRVAGINSFMWQNVNGWNDSLRTGNHILFVYENSFSQSMRFRRQATTWRQPPANDRVGHWNGSDLFATLNDPTYGIIKLMEQTDLGSYIFSGSEGRGLQYMAFGRDSATSTSVTNAKASYRGRLFIPTYDELGYHTGVYEQILKTWALYNGTSKFSHSHDRNFWVDHTAGWAYDRGAIIEYRGRAANNMADSQYTVRFAFIFQ